MFDEETERARRGARARGRVSERRAAQPARLEDRDDAARQRGGRAERAERARPRRRLRRAAGAGARRAASATTSSCRRRTATPARRRSSSPSQADWDEHADEIVGEELKVMRRINCREAAVEGVDHAARHAGRAADDRARRLPRADALRRRLVRQRRLRRRSLGPTTASSRAALHAADGRPAAPGGLPRLLRARLPGRRRHRRAVPRRAQPARHRRELDDERDRRRLRRHAAVPVPPARVHGRRLRDRRRRAQRRAGRSRRAIDAWSQFILKQTDDDGRAHHAGAAVRHLAAGRQTGRSRFVRRGTDWHTVATSARRSTCGSPTPAATATRAPTSASSSRAAACRTTTTSSTDARTAWIDGHQGPVPERPARPRPAASRSRRRSRSRFKML